MADSYSSLWLKSNPVAVLTATSNRLTLSL